jgi:hypothetical protein
MKLFTHLLFFSVALNGASAFPSGAGGCGGGSAAVRGSHLQSGFETGSLGDGGFQVILDGDTLSPGDQVSFTVGEDHVLTVSGSFLGILVRLAAADGVDTSAALSEDSNLLQDASACSAPVVGITHNSRVGKNGAEVILRLDEPSLVTLDITVVLGNGGGESIFYYSGFALAAVDASTSAPSVSPPVSTTDPTPVPTLAPTPVPTALPSSSPVSATGVPSWSPSELPSLLTSAPSSVQVDASVEPSSEASSFPSPLPSLSSPPSIRPSGRPSSAPSLSPSANPPTTGSPTPAPVIPTGLPTIMPVAFDGRTSPTSTSIPTTGSSAGHVLSLAAYSTVLTVVVSIHMLLS